MKELISTFPAPEKATPEDIKLAILEWRGFKDQRLEANRKVRDLEKVENAIFGWLVEAFQRTAMDGLVVGGKVTGLTKGTVLTVTDKEALANHIKETKDIYLLEFRLSQSSVREHMEAGEVIPGVEEVETFGLYNRKA